jgi:hypothetical protein
MVMTDDVVPIAWPKDHRDKMFIQILCRLFSFFITLIALAFV